VNGFFLEKSTVSQIAKKFPVLMKPDGSLPCPHKFATGPYPERVQSNPHPHTLLLLDLF